MDVNVLYFSVYSDETHKILKQLIGTPEICRLSDIGMHCGCDYTNLIAYKQAKISYTRLVHSVGVANIIWNFTKDITQAIAGLLHDISTPVFAHTIDFMNNDHISQVSTEEKTLLFIKNSKKIMSILDDNDIDIYRVCNYHEYPIADNDIPSLSADRLEYTLGNSYIVENVSLDVIKNIYSDLVIVKNEDNIDELCFKSLAMAHSFTEMSLINSFRFLSDENRFCMQYLADIIKYAIQNKYLTYDELYTTETQVIRKMQSTPILSTKWHNFTQLSTIIATDKRELNKYCVNIPAKKRYINPLVIYNGSIKRIADIDEAINKKLHDLLNLDFNKWLSTK